MKAVVRPTFASLPTTRWNFGISPVSINQLSEPRNLVFFCLFGCGRKSQQGRLSSPRLYHFLRTSQTFRSMYTNISAGAWKHFGPPPTNISTETHRHFGSPFKHFGRTGKHFSPSASAFLPTPLPCHCFGSRNPVFFRRIEPLWTAASTPVPEEPSLPTPAEGFIWLNWYIFLWSGVLSTGGNNR